MIFVEYTAPSALPVLANSKLFNPSHWRRKLIYTHNRKSIHEEFKHTVSNNNYCSSCYHVSIPVCRSIITESSCPVAWLWVKESFNGWWKQVIVAWYNSKGSEPISTIGHFLLLHHGRGCMSVPYALMNLTYSRRYKHQGPVVQWMENTIRWITQ